MDSRGGNRALAPHRARGHRTPSGARGSAHAERSSAYLGPSSSRVSSTALTRRARPAERAPPTSDAAHASEPPRDPPEGGAKKSNRRDSVTRYLVLKKNVKVLYGYLVSKKCRDLGLNLGPLDLQSSALPTELSQLRENSDYRLGRCRVEGFCHCMFAVPVRTV